jgi:Tfp pilus assembly protein FimV
VQARQVARVAAGRPAQPGDEKHTVRPAESLWAIASDMLGRDASPARVAREVHRLWKLNHERIGTGDPDLLEIGTKLNLR